MNRESLEKLRTKVVKNLELVQKKVEDVGVEAYEQNQVHHLFIRYSKLLLVIENKMASLK